MFLDLCTKFGLSKETESYVVLFLTFQGASQRVRVEASGIASTWWEMKTQNNSQSEGGILSPTLTLICLLCFSSFHPKLLFPYHSYLEILGGKTLTCLMCILILTVWQKGHTLSVSERTTYINLYTMKKGWEGKRWQKQRVDRNKYFKYCIKSEVWTH